MPLSITATLTPRPALPVHAQSAVMSSRGSMGTTCRNASDRNGPEYAGWVGISRACRSSLPQLSPRVNVDGEGAQNLHASLELGPTPLGDLMHEPGQLERALEPGVLLGGRRFKQQ